MSLARVMRILPALVTMAVSTAALPHSASDAYLTLEVASPAPGAATIVRAQWDIALRDLDFTIGLDEDGDGRITWGELRRRQTEIAQLAYDRLAVSADGKACSLRPLRQLVSAHADGAYAALFFDIACPGSADRMTLDYRLFFDVDPSHRCIVVMRAGGETSTALLAPGSAGIGFKLPRPD
jgi:hypothetical protein